MYRIIFNDGSSYEGGNPENSGWNKIPNKPIVELHYELCGKKITLKNYEAYNHLVKYAYMIDSQQQIIVAVILMIKEYDTVKRVIFDLIKNELTCDTVPYGNEYNNKPASGWKAGLSNLKTKIKID